MLLMMAEVLELRKVSLAHPTSEVWHFLSSLQTHSSWVGCSLHDLIQPSFSFLVGVALPFSTAKRLSLGHSKTSLLIHTVRRSIILIILGVFLRSLGHPITNWTFEDTLTQIGLGYTFLFVLSLRPIRDQWIAFTVILVGVWAAFAFYTAPTELTSLHFISKPSFMDPHALTGFASHWQRGSNPAAVFDQWFLNLFPRENVFIANRGGYTTLSFIPTLATMLLGLIAGNILRSSSSDKQKVRIFIYAGILGIISGLFFSWLGICPIVKRIWTPSWVLFSGGFCFLFLSLFYTTLDIRKSSRWALPLFVVGSNSMAAYLLAHLVENFISTSLITHLGLKPFEIFGLAYEHLTLSMTTFALMWFILYCMYKKKLFLKI